MGPWNYIYIYSYMSIFIEKMVAIEVDGHPSVLLIVFVPNSFERLPNALVRKCVGYAGKRCLSLSSHFISCL